MMGKVDTFLKLSDDELVAYITQSKAKAHGRVIPPFAARYLDSVMSDLRLFSPDFQTKLLSIRTPCTGAATCRRADNGMSLLRGGSEALAIR
jgi:hypothetical protein